MLNVVILDPLSEPGQVQQASAHLSDYPQPVRFWVLAEDPQAVNMTEASQVSFFSTFDSLCQALQQRADIPTLVSALMPSRHRFAALKQSIERLIDSMQHPKGLELFLLLDLDDESSLGQLHTLVLPVDWVLLLHPHQGYHSLYHQLNQMAQLAKSEWGMLFTDDAFFGTPHWDVILRRYLHQICVLRIHSGTDFNIFPIYSRRLLEWMGNLGLDKGVDNWLEDVARFLGIECSEPGIVVVHQTDLGETHARVEQTEIAIEIFEERHKSVAQILAGVQHTLTDPTDGAAYAECVRLHQQFEGICAYHMRPECLYSRMNLMPNLYALTPLAKWDEASCKHVLDATRLNFENIAEQGLAMGVSDLVHLLDRQRLQPDLDISSDLQKSQELFGWVLHHCPQHVLALYYVMWIDWYCGIHERALDTAHQILAQIKAGSYQLPATQWQQMMPLGPPVFLHAWDTVTLYQPASSQTEQYLDLLQWQVWHLMGMVFHQQQQWEQAQQAYQQALQFHPFFVTRLFLAQTLLSQGHIPHFSEVLSALQADCPAVVDLWGDLPFVLLQQQQAQLCLAVVSQSVLLQPSEKQALTELACLGLNQVKGCRLFDMLFQGVDTAYLHVLVRWQSLGERLEHTIAVNWHPLCPEGPLPVAAKDGFCAVEHAADLSIQDKEIPPSPNIYRRVYGASDLTRGRIGLDLCPPVFPHFDTCESTEIEGLGTFNLLILYDCLSAQYIEDLLDVLSHHPEWTGVLWNPFKEPEPNELKWLETRCTDDLNIVLLTEPLKPIAQYALLQQVDLLVAPPQEWMIYYLWWALWCGTPVGSLGPLHSCYDSLETVALAPFVWSDAAIDLVRVEQAYPVYKAKGLTVQRVLKQMGATSMSNRILSTLWLLWFSGCHKLPSLASSG